MDTTAKVRKVLGSRRIEAEWQTGLDRFVVLSCSHSKGSGALVASLRRERAETSCGLESRIFAPFQDIQRIAVSHIPRYSAKVLEAFFAAERERVERVLEGKGFDPQAAEITAIFTQPTEA